MRRQAGSAPTGTERRGAGIPAGILRTLTGGGAAVLAAALLAAMAFAQSSSSGSILERLQQMQRQDQVPSGEATVPAPSTPLETLIAPDKYRLFSGDQLHLGIWGEIPRSYLIPVGPEGDLVLPGQGPLRVAGLTLQEAEAAVISALRPSFGRSRITLRLTQPARFRVMVTGLVAKPGIYEVTGTDRLSALLEASGGVRPGGSLRRIAIVPSGDGTDGSGPREVDLLPWSLRGDVGANPFLEPGIRVEVPAQGSTVRIRGPVFSRGPLLAPVMTPVRIGDRPEEEPDLFLEMREKDTVGTLLDQVGGLSDRATGRGTLLRGSEPPRTLNLLSAEARTLLLRPGDELEVEYTIRWIFVTGSVRTPGRVPYLPGLGARDYVNLAGGPTEIGRTSGWTIEAPGQKRMPIAEASSVPPGSILRVPERRSYKTSTWLSPLSTATAVVISIVALSRR